MSQKLHGADIKCGLYFYNWKGSFALLYFLVWLCNCRQMVMQAIYFLEHQSLYYFFFFWMKLTAKQPAICYADIFYICNILTSIDAEFYFGIQVMRYFLSCWTCSSCFVKLLGRCIYSFVCKGFSPGHLSGSIDDPLKWFANSWR